MYPPTQPYASTQPVPYHGQSPSAYLQGSLNDPPPSYADAGLDGASSADRNHLHEKDGSDEILQRALGFTRCRPPTYAAPSRLEKPVVIPQVASGPGLPWVRAYATVLAQHGVSVDEFVEFIDSLNVVASSSPPLQVLGMAGGIVGFIPFAHAQLVGMGIQAVAKIGSKALMSTRGSSFVKKANTDFFNPRRLNMSLVRGDALRAKLGLGFDTPLSAHDTRNLSSAERKLAAFKGYVEPLTFSVPPPSEPATTLKKLTAKQQKMNVWKIERKAKKTQADYAQKSGDLDQKMREEIHKMDSERNEVIRRRDDELRKAGGHRDEQRKVIAEFEKKMRELDQEYQKVHDKYGEDKYKEGDSGGNDDQAIWIVIENL